MGRRFGPFSRWGSLVNAIFTGAITVFSMVRLTAFGEALPLYFPFIAAIFAVFVAIAVYVWWRHDNGGAGLSDEDVQ